MSNSYELTGTIKQIGETQTLESGFTKREFVVTTEGNYPQDIKLSFIKDKTSDLDNYRPGQRVDVAFNIRGNEYNGRHYVDLAAWKIASAPGETAVDTGGSPGPSYDDASDDVDTGGVPF